MTIAKETRTVLLAIRTRLRQDTESNKPKYVEKTLGEGERILYVGNYHWLWEAGVWLCLVTIILIPIAVLLVINMISTEIAVTNRRFVFKKGFIVRHTQEFGLRRIQGVNVDQDFFGRVLNYGKLKISGIGDEDIELPDLIGNPLELKIAIEKAKADLEIGG
jgi:uncharacterized membrane protein YdbT with pleckstrin-like domain